MLNVYKKAKRLLRQFIRNATIYHRQKSAMKHMRARKSDKIAVAFIVFEPETWDKQEAVYSEMLKREAFEVDVVVLPNFDDHLEPQEHYGSELVFFEQKCEKVLRAYDDLGDNPFESMGKYDYVFYQDPYEQHYPSFLQPKRIMSLSRICLIPYGHSGSDVFLGGSVHNTFYQMLSLGFEASEYHARLCKQTLEKGVLGKNRHFDFFGYPVYEKYMSATQHNTDIAHITWTPRWSYDPKRGGSHFLEYKDHFISLVKKYPNISFSFRPHPMMFAELERTGLFSQAEADKYQMLLHENQVNISTKTDIADVLFSTDLLITDYSSIISMYALLGRPSIYCEGGIPLNEEYTSIKQGMYSANSWDDVEKHIESLLSGSDPLSSKRTSIRLELGKSSIGSSKRIVERIIEDYAQITQEKSLQR